MSQITYAKANDPECRGLRVFDLDTGAEIMDVYEVDTTAGYVLHAKRNEKGCIYANGDEIATERLTGNFIIRRPEECA